MQTAVLTDFIALEVKLINEAGYFPFFEYRQQIP